MADVDPGCTCIARDITDIDTTSPGDIRTGDVAGIDGALAPTTGGCMDITATVAFAAVTSTDVAVAIDDMTGDGTAAAPPTSRNCRGGAGHRL